MINITVCVRYCYLQCVFFFINISSNHYDNIQVIDAMIPDHHKDICNTFCSLPILQFLKVAMILYCMLNIHSVRKICIIDLSHSYLAIRYVIRVPLLIKKCDQITYFHAIFVNFWMVTQSKDLMRKFPGF